MLKNCLYGPMMNYVFSFLCFRHVTMGNLLTVVLLYLSTSLLI